MYKFVKARTGFALVTWRCWYNAPTHEADTLCWKRIRVLEFKSMCDYNEFYLNLKLTSLALFTSPDE